jgi:hypothetical protein
MIAGDVAVRYGSARARTFATQAKLHDIVTAFYDFVQPESRGSARRVSAALVSCTIPPWHAIGWYRSRAPSTGGDIMKRIASAFAAFAIAAVMAAPAMAQNAQSDVTGELHQGNTTIVFERGSVGPQLEQMSAFSNLASNDPKLANTLARNPALVEKDSFVSKHPALAQYLQQFPDARADIVANPGNYLTPVPGSTWNHAAPGIKAMGDS